MKVDLILFSGGENLVVTKRDRPPVRYYDTDSCRDSLSDSLNDSLSDSLNDSLSDSDEEPMAGNSKRNPTPSAEK